MDANTTSYSAYGVPVFYEEGKALQFKDIRVTFLGNYDVVKGGMKTSLQSDNFSVVDSRGVENLLEIGNGQLPNKPESFIVEGHHFTLYTFEAPDKTRLKDSYLVITKENKAD